MLYLGHSASSGRVQIPTQAGFMLVPIIPFRFTSGARNKKDYLNKPEVPSISFQKKN